MSSSTARGAVLRRGEELSLLSDLQWYSRLSGWEPPVSLSAEFATLFAGSSSTSTRLLLLIFLPICELNVCTMT